MNLCKIVCERLVFYCELRVFTYEKQLDQIQYKRNSSFI